LSALKAAGVREVIFNVNNAGARGKWEWDGKRSAILKRAQEARAAGLSVGWMPWMWCTPEFMARCGKEVEALDRDFGAGGGGGGARLVQLDCEGSAERGAGKRARRAGMSLEEYVGACMRAMCEHLPPSITLGITTLYFRRPVGDTCIRWGEEVAGRWWSVEEWIGQFYSPWLTSPPHSASKARATHAANFQPGILQRRGDEFNRPLYEHMTDRGAGLNLWALRRPGMSAEEAMDRAVEEVRGQGHNTVAGWAGHLIARNSARFDLTVRAFDRLCNGGPAVVTRSPPGGGAWPNDPPGARVLWGEWWRDEAIAGGGRPSGYVPIRAAGLNARDVGGLARVVRGEVMRRGWGRGACVPCVFKSRRLVCVLQRHTATYRGGVLVRGLDLDGLTIFAKRS
jgi:hypothetical protein